MWRVYMKFLNKESLILLDETCDKDVGRQLELLLDNIYEIKSLVDKADQDVFNNEAEESVDNLRNRLLSIKRLILMLERNDLVDNEKVYIVGEARHELLDENDYVRRKNYNEQVNRIKYENRNELKHIMDNKNTPEKIRDINKLIMALYREAYEPYEYGKFKDKPNRSIYYDNISYYADVKETYIKYINKLVRAIECYVTLKMRELSKFHVIKLFMNFLSNVCRIKR